MPILSEEGTVLEAVSENDVILKRIKNLMKIKNVKAQKFLNKKNLIRDQICGETGSGKTTQVPQFLYEAGYGNLGTIGMTEPRRIAAISAAERIRYEMDKKEPFIAHHIRYETKVTAETKISVMTDGVLLKQMATDFLLKNYSVIILDEAHERYLFL